MPEKGMGRWQWILALDVLESLSLMDGLQTVVLEKTLGLQGNQTSPS